MADGDLIYTGPDQSGAGAPVAPGAPGAGGTMDASQVTGQDPESFLGIPFSYSTGLGGSPPPDGGIDDPTNQPGQYPASDTLAGEPLGGSGLDGSQGAPAAQIEEPGTAFQVTDPNYTAGKPGGGSGTQLVSVEVGIGGPNDSTLVAGQYPPARPLPAGDFYPTDDGMGQGSVLVGGFKKGDRG